MQLCIRHRGTEVPEVTVRHMKWITVVLYVPGYDLLLESSLWMAVSWQIASLNWLSST